MKKEIILIIPITFLIFLLGFNYAKAVNINSCQELSTANEIYTLTQNVSASGTCFNVTANNITLDCNGYTINYSGSSSGYGVYATGRNNITVRNCRIMQTGTSSSSHGVYYGTGAGNRHTFQNNFIYTRGSSSYGIYLYSQHDSLINNTNISTVGSQSHAIYLYTSNNETIANSYMNTTQANALLIYAGSTYSTAESYRFNHTITNSYAEGLPIVYYFNLQNQTIENQNWSNTYGAWICGYCNNITLRNISIRNDGISIYKTQNSRFFDLNIDSTNGNGLTSFSYSRNNQYKNITIKITTNANIRALTNYYSTNQTFENVSINTTTSSAYAVILSTNTNESYRDFYITTSGSSGFGLYIAGAQTNVNFSRFFFNSTGSSSYGVYIGGNLVNTTIYDSSFRSTGSTAYALYGYSGSANLEIFNTILNSTSSNDIFIRNNTAISGIISLINTTFNKSEPFFVAGSVSPAQLYIRWLINFNVTNKSNNPLSDVSIRVRDNANNLECSGLTDSNGLYSNCISKEELRNSTGNYSFNNHSIVYFKDGYNSHMELQNITQNRNFSIVLNESVSTIPSVTFIQPTPSNGENISRSYVVINTSVYTYDWGYYTPQSVYASSGEDPQNPASNTIDNDLESHWSNSAPSSQWIAYDYGSSYNHSSLRILTNPIMENSVCGISAIYITNDPFDWGSSLGSCDFSGGAPQWYNCNFNAKVGRYLRINIKIRQGPQCRDTSVFPLPLNNFKEFQSWTYAFPGTIEDCTLKWIYNNVSNDMPMDKQQDGDIFYCYYNNTNLQNGDHLFYVSATDTNGQTGNSEKRTIIIDRRIPIITFIPPTPSNNESNNKTEQEIEVSVNVQADSCTLDVYRNNQKDSYPMYIIGSDPYIFYRKIQTEEGRYDYNVSCIYGSEVGWSENRTLFVDLTRPSIELGIPVNGTYYKEKNISFNLMCSDNNGVSNVEIYGDWGTNTISPLSVYASSGEDIGYPASNTIDNDLESYWSNSVPSSQYIQYFIKSSSDNYSGVSIYTNPELTYAVCGISSIRFSEDPSRGWRQNVLTSDCNFFSLSSEPQWYTCSFNETSGNYTYINLKIRNALGSCVDTQISVLPLNYFYEFKMVSNQTFGVIANNSSYVNGEWWEYSTTLSTDGKHEWFASCYDFAGNSITSETRSFFIDLTLPTELQWINPTPSQNEKLRNGQVTLNFSFIEENPSNCTIQINGNNFSANLYENYCQLTINLDDGTYNVVGYIKDMAGNSNRTESRRFYIDSTPPSVYFNPSTTSGIKTQDYVFINVTCTDNSEIEEVILTWQGINESFDYNEGNYYYENKTGLPFGVYRFEAWCIDEFNNINKTELKTVILRTTLGGGGGGTGTANCEDNGGFCVDGDVCPVGSEKMNYYCSSKRICCSINYCKLCDNFFSMYGFSTYSVFDIDTFFSSLPNKESVNKTKFKEYLKDYNKKCGIYCFIFNIPILGPLFEKAGMFLNKQIPQLSTCTWAIIISIAIILLILYFIYRSRKRKKKRY